MKKTIPWFVLPVILFAACHNPKQPQTGEQTDTLNRIRVSRGDTAGASNQATTSISLGPIVEYYLQLKNALVEENSKQAAAAGRLVEASLKNMNTGALQDTLKKTYNDIAETAIENAEHIGKNGGNIAHQREHFEMLSEDIYDLVKAFGIEQTLYVFSCPDNHVGKGAIWLGESEEIKNPYTGKSKPACGSLKEQLK